MKMLYFISTLLIDFLTRGGTIHLQCAQKHRWGEGGSVNIKKVESKSVQKILKRIEYLNCMSIDHWRRLYIENCSMKTCTDQEKGNSSYVPLKSHLEDLLLPIWMFFFSFGWGYFFMKLWFAKFSRCRNHLNLNICQGKNEWIPVWLKK